MPGKRALSSTGENYTFHVPNYYYGVVCDPVAKESVGFWGVNNGNYEEAKATTNRLRSVTEVEKKFGINLLPAEYCSTDKIADWPEFTNEIPEAASTPAVGNASPKASKANIRFDGCSDHFAAGFVPRYTDSAQKPKETVDLCSSRSAFYATLYDADFSVPAWSAYIAQPFREGGTRKNTWRQDDAPELEAADQQPADSKYWPKDYDRGQVAPIDALHTSDAGADSTFLATNVAAQHKSLNRYAWKTRETDIRDRADAKDLPLYVVVGVGFDDRSNPNKIFGKRVLPSTGEKYAFHVPNYYYGVVCDPVAKESVGFWGVNNGNEEEAEATTGRLRTVAEVEKKFGINLLPAEHCNTYEIADWPEFTNKKPKVASSTTRLGATGPSSRKAQPAEEEEVDRCNNKHNPHPLPEPEVPETCDFIVVGAGTGGVVVAKRLAEVKEWTICVMERGKSETQWEDSLFNWYNKWGHWSKGPKPFEFISPNDPNWFSTPQLCTNRTYCDKDGKLIYIPRFRGIGGTSRIYGAISVRPHSQLLEKRWPEGWQEEDLLPYYRHLEDHVCYHSPDGTPPSEECKKYHGKDGPMPINKLHEPHFKAFSRRFTKFCDDPDTLWEKRVDDYNAKTEDMKGCSIFQQYTHRAEDRTNLTADTARGGSFTGYLKCNHVPKQSNLKIFLNSPVTRIEFDEDKRATGVTILQKDGTTKFVRTTKEVIVAGGAFDTPHILQVSGVGNREHLESVGIEVVAENDRVGEDLWDHISVPYVLEYDEEELKKAEAEVEVPEYSSNGPFSWILQFNTGVFKDDLKDVRDMQIYFMDNSPMFSATDIVCRPEGKVTGPITQLRLIHQYPTYRGSVKATSPSVFDKPLLDMNWTYPMPADDYDVFDRTIAQLRKLLFSDNEWGRLIKSEIAPGFDPNDPKKSKEMLTEYLRTAMVSALHPTCTCRMGSDPAKSCSDGRLRVRGVKGVRVSDASAFATQVDGNPAQMIMTLAEKLADMLKTEYGKGADNPLEENAIFLWQQEARELASDEIRALANLPATVDLGNGQSYIFTDVTKDVDGGFTASLANAASFGLKEAKFKSTLLAAPFTAWKMSFTVVTDGKSKVNVHQMADEFNARFSRIYNIQYAFIIMHFAPHKLHLPSPEDDLPLYTEATASPSENKGGARPGSVKRPRIFVCWRHNFAAYQVEPMWREKVGTWYGQLKDGTYSTFPGSLNSFKLDDLPEMFEYIVWYSNDVKAFVYRMTRTEPPGQPGVDYISTKKAVPFGTLGSGWIRSSSLIVDEGSDPMEAAEAILFDVFMSGGRRFESYSFWDILPGDELLIRRAPEKLQPGGKTAAFDLDNTIVRTKSGETFAEGEWDWVFLCEKCANDTFHQLYEEGYNIAILSNQRGLNQHGTTTDSWINKVDDIIHKFRLPINVIAALGYDSGKPNTAMWDAYVKHFDPDADTIQSFYAGDAGGNVGDYSDSDKKFAENAGLPFRNPSDVYGPDFKLRPWDVEETIALNVTCEVAWAVIGDFWSISDWNPWISEVETHDEEKKIRGCVFPGQPADYEQETTRTATSYTYKWVAGAWGEHHEDYYSQLSVHEQNNGKACKVQWVGAFKQYSDQGVIEFYRSGLDYLPEFFAKKD